MKPSQLHLLHILLLPLSAFIIVYLTLQSKHRDKSTPLGFQQLSTNWKQGAIFDISVTSDSCPAGSEEAFYYTWPGNPTRCYCADVPLFTRLSYNINADKYLDACNATQIKAGCRNIESQSPVNISALTTSAGQGMKICVQRSSETWASNGPKSDKPCKEAGLSSCGRTRENTFCTKEKKCPITNVQVVQGYTAAEVTNCRYEDGCVVLSAENNLIVKFERNSYDGLPVSEFKLTEYRICQDNRKDNISPGRKEYWALGVQRTPCETLGTDLWPSIGFTLTEKQIFDMNGVTPKVDYYSAFDGYYEKGKWKSGANFNWHLYSRGYIPWSLGCRSQMGMITESDEYFGRAGTAQTVQFFIVVLGALAWGIGVPYLFFTRKHLMRAKVGNIVGKLVQGAIQIYAFKTAEVIVNNLNSFSEQKCTNEPFLNLLEEGSGEIRSVYHYDMAGIVILAAILAFDIGKEVYLRFFMKEKYHPELNAELQQEEKVVKVVGGAGIHHV